MSNVRFPQITDAQVAAVDFMNIPNAKLALDLLQNLPYVETTRESTAGATGETVNALVFVAPVAMEIQKVDFITTVVQTGTGNTPTVSLYEGANEVAVSAAIDLGGAIGDSEALVVDAAKSTLEAGDKLTFRIVNPSATITVALSGFLQIIWKPVV